MKNWTLAELQELYHSPLLELVFKAASVHREHHNPREVQISTLLSIKTGGCPEDCGYCPQAARYHTGVEKNDLMTVEQVETAAKRAKALGSSMIVAPSLPSILPSPPNSTIMPRLPSKAVALTLSIFTETMSLKVYGQ